MRGGTSLPITSIRMWPPRSSRYPPNCSSGSGARLRGGASASTCRGASLVEISAHQRRRRAAGRSTSNGADHRPQVLDQASSRWPSRRGRQSPVRSQGSRCGRRAKRFRISTRNAPPPFSSRAKGPARSLASQRRSDRGCVSYPICRQQSCVRESRRDGNIRAIATLAPAHIPPADGRLQVAGSSSSGCPRSGGGITKFQINTENLCRQHGQAKSAVRR
jgi:hypothetical protein